MIGKRTFPKLDVLRRTAVPIAQPARNRENLLYQRARQDGILDVIERMPSHAMMVGASETAMTVGNNHVEPMTSSLGNAK
jgi:hypothetical protein